MNTEINSFTERPLYLIKIKSSGVAFDIRINDFPILQFNDSKGGGTEIEVPINTAILSSGQQEVSIKVFPLIGKSTISQNAEFEFEVNKKNDAWIFDGKREIILSKTTLQKNNLPLWEYTTNFNAIVPYSFVGWSKSKDLSEIENLSALLNEAYLKIAKIIEEKDNNYFKKIVKTATEVDIMLYDKNDENQEFDSEPEIVLPMNNCVLKFYGNNRIVRYESLNFESCFKTKINYNNSEEIYTYPFYFHMPPGSSELEIIR